MTLQERLDSDLRDAMRNNEVARKLAIRAVKTAVIEAQVAGAQERVLTDSDVMAIIAKQIKQRRDSITEFAKGGRQDLIAKEEAEIAVLETYLPRQLDEAAIREHARRAIAELGVTDLRGLGPVMKRLAVELRGLADGQVVNRVVRALLAP
jgi:hypothetical protein